MSDDEAARLEQLEARLADAEQRLQSSDVNLSRDVNPPITVYDLGPDAPEERRKWEKEHGGGPVRLTTHQRDIVELGRGRYVTELPAGATVSKSVIHS
jgi:hypothetical protein